MIGVIREMKIGIFGGCFNPPHNMHKNIATKLVEYGYLDKVILVPTGNDYIKQELIDVEKRYEMLRILIRNIPYLRVSRFETTGGKVTFETLNYFKQKYPEDEIYFICGSDNLEELSTWDLYEEILKKYKVLVITRNHDKTDKIIEKYKSYQNHIIIGEIDENNISSTEIRKWVKLKKYDLLKVYLEDDILDYIKKNNLYT